MKERGMIFNDPMVRAILDGSKTQTRRIMRVQPDSPNFGLLRIVESTARSDVGKYHWSESNACGNHTRSKLFTCPFGAVGDRIWVRETFAAFDADWKFPGRPNDLRDGPWPNLIYSAGSEKAPPKGTCRPSIHMPRWASRITLEITDVRVEQLSSISEEDARAEGCAGGHDSIPDYHYSATPNEHFRHVWTSIYGEESWLANQWAWVIEFRRIEGNAA